MTPTSLSIGALADQSGCAVPTIRYYEEIGLLPPARRTAGGHRHYGESELLRLQFVKRCRDFGFPIEQVRELVALFDNGDGDCVEARDVAQVQLAAVRSRLAALAELEAKLAAFVTSCDSSCLGGANRDCCIIDDLSANPAAFASCNTACGAPAEAIDIAATELRRRARTGCG